MKARILVCLLLTVSLLASTASYARWMNPSTGRFHTMDTFEGRQADPQSLHKYLYCQANPVNNIDPTGNAVYVVTRPLDIDTLRHAGGLAVHVFLVFDTEGLSDVEEWQKTVRDSCDSDKHPSANGDRYEFMDSPVTFSFHPKSVRNGDHTGEYWGPVLTPGSYVAYNARIDRNAFDKDGTGYKRYKVATGQQKQIDIYNFAVVSRDSNNNNRPDPGNYSFAVNNCGSWVEHILQQNGIAFPDRTINDGTGLGPGNPAGRGVFGAAVTCCSVGQAVRDLFLEIFPIFNGPGP